MEIKVDDLSDPRIATFLDEHIADMKSISPPESKHALDIDGLKKPDIIFWTVWEEDNLLGCGALKKLSKDHAEIKSMRVGSSFRGKGIASFILKHILSEATSMGYTRLSLETGSMPFFAPARKLYEKFGFLHCAPFANYQEDPNSVFMTLQISRNI